MNDTEILDETIRRIESDMLHPSTYEPGGEYAHDMGQCYGLAAIRKSILSMRKGDKEDE